MLESLQLSVLDCLDVFQVPLDDRPRWLRLLVALERAYRTFVLEQAARRRSSGKEEPDGIE